MSIESVDFEIRFSGGASNNSGDASLGGVKSSNEAPETLNALFDAVGAAEALSGDIEYRCVYVHNGNVSDTMTDLRAYIASQTPSVDTALAIGVGTAAINGTEQTVGNESTAPSGVSFSSPATAGTGIALGNLTTGQHKAVWIRRTVDAAAANVTDSATLGFRCETV